MGESRKRFFVWAGSFQQYQYWRAYHGLSGMEAKYIARASCLRGLADADIYCVGTYMGHPDASEIYEAVQLGVKHNGLRLHKEDL